MLKSAYPALPPGVEHLETYSILKMDFASSDDKESACNARDHSLIPGLEKSPGEGNGNPVQYSLCLKNSTHREAWWATVHGVTKSQTRLSD